MVLLVTEPLETLSELAAAGVDGPSALALWERFHRLALAGLRGLAVFVTSRTSASNDRAWGRDLQAFLARHGVAASGRPLRSPFAPGPGAPGATGSGNDEPCAKDEGLLLASQQQLASLLEQLLGPHDRFDPPPPEPESPWVGAVLERGRDLEQVWEGLDWATRPARLLRDRPPRTSEIDEARAVPGERDRGPARLPPLARAAGRADGAAAERRPPGGAGTGAPASAAAVQRRRPRATAPRRGRSSGASPPCSPRAIRGFQLVLADDASGDAALEDQLRSFARLDPRVELVLRDENGGISAATNSALEHARGEHLVFLDHDDELHPAALEADGRRDRRASRGRRPVLRRGQAEPVGRALRADASSPTGRPTCS